MYRMLKNVSFALLLATASLAGPPASAELTAKDAAIETSTARVTIPTTIGGSVSARGCRSCKYVTLSLADTTRFFIGRRELSADQYRKAVADGRPRGLTITYDQSTREMTRIVLREGSAQIPRS